MADLNAFVNLLCGHFDNREQYESLKSAGKEFPFAEHVNTVCNDKITALPQDFAGTFIVEESYYETAGKRHASPHLFLFTAKGDGVELTSYEVPAGNDKATFSYDTMVPVAFGDLVRSERFTPALYREHNGVWEGGSTSMFSPVMKFTLFERFSAQQLEVSETIEVKGKRVFGYDEPIIYKRVSTLGENE